MLIKNATLLSLAGSTVERADLRIEQGLITAKGKKLKATTGEKSLDLSGKFVMPGMVCGHTHLYSALARGMPAPKKTPRNFYEILKYVWWTLDRALDDEAVYYSALVGTLDAVHCGTTTLIDHHASPNFIRGSLGTMGDAFEKIGLRGVLCYEVTDRNGVHGNGGVDDLIRRVALRDPDGECGPASGNEDAAHLGDRGLWLREVEDAEVHRYRIERSIPEWQPLSIAGDEPASGATPARALDHRDGHVEADRLGAAHRSCHRDVSRPASHVQQPRTCTHSGSV